jgi:hypothetical protein
MAVAPRIGCQSQSVASAISPSKPVTTTRVSRGPVPEPPPIKEFLYNFKGAPPARHRPVLGCTTTLDSASNAMPLVFTGTSICLSVAAGLQRWQRAASRRSSCISSRAGTGVGPTSNTNPDVSGDQRSLYRWHLQVTVKLSIAAFWRSGSADAFHHEVSGRLRLVRRRGLSPPCCHLQPDSIRLGHARDWAWVSRPE